MSDELRKLLVNIVSMTDAKTFRIAKETSGYTGSYEQLFSDITQTIENAKQTKRIIKIVKEIVENGQ